MSDSTEHHVNYWKIWAILVGLLVVSVLGPMLEVQAITLITACGIAVVKAYLVAKNFMHLNLEKRFVPYMRATALLFVLLFFAGVAPDVMKDSGDGWVKDPALWNPPVSETVGHGSAQH